MPGPFRKPFDEEFKRNAVDLWVHSGKPLKVIARELGISDVTLRGWRDRILDLPPVRGPKAKRVQLGTA